MFESRIICNSDGDIELACLIDKKTNKPEMPWIEFKAIENKVYPSQKLTWDNGDFIFGKFYKFLKRWDNRKLKKNDLQKFEDIKDILSDESVWEMIEMIEYALEKGWYEPKTE